MKIVVPFTKVMPEVATALPDAEWIDVSGSDEAYWEMFRTLWAARETFVVVEHDIVTTTDHIDDLLLCPSEWCASGYDFENLGMIHGLGCAKFEASLMERLPDAFDVIGTWQTSEHPPRHWCSLDSWVQAYLGQQRVRCHHHGVVRHLSVRRSHDGCRPAGAV